MVEQPSEFHCAKCGLQLPLVVTEKSDEASEWVCTECGEVYVAEFDTTAPDELWGHVRRKEFPPVE